MSILNENSRKIPAKYKICRALQDRLLKIVLQQVRSGKCVRSVSGVSEVHVSMLIELRLGSAGAAPRSFLSLYPLQALLAIENNFYIHFVTT